MKRAPSSPPRDVRSFLPLSAADYHLLLVLAERDLYGYAILQAMKRDSAGAVSLDIGSLYRVVARLEGAGLVEEAAGPAGDEPPSPGRPRRYYRLTDLGREVLQQEVERLKRAVSVAAGRNLASERGR